MHSAVTRRVLAVPRLGDPGGGTGQVGQLLLDAFTGAWPRSIQVRELRGHAGAPPTVAAKVAFGSRLLIDQVFDRPRWIAYGHLGLAGVQRIVPRGWGSPYAVFLYGVEAWKPLDVQVRRQLRDARLRIAISDFTARRVATSNADVGPIVVCPLAIPRPASGAAVLPSGVHPKPIVLIVGRMAAGEGYKGHDQLIDAWPFVAAAVPGAELLIAGGGDDVDRLREKARRVAPESAITFTGFVDRAALDRLYGEAAVFAMPSRGEGFGLVYLEAMAHRLPCLGSVHDAAGEVIEHGKTGLLVNLDEPDALGRALVCLLRDPALRRRMGEAGFERLGRHFSFDRFARDIVRVFETQMEGARP